MTVGVFVFLAVGWCVSLLLASIGLLGGGVLVVVDLVQKIRARRRSRRELPRAQVVSSPRPHESTADR